MTFIAAGIIYSASFVAPARSANAPKPAAAKVSTPATPKSVARQSAPAAEAENLSGALPGSAFGFMPLFQSGAETIATYAADCVTPKTVFALGETVCAKVENAPLPLRLTRPLRRFAWVGTANTKRQQSDITSATETNLFTLPATSTSIIGGASVDNRGDWTVISTNTSDGSARVKAVFSVRDAAQPAANLSVSNFHLDGGEVFAGQSAVFKVAVLNRGPDAAANVELTNVVPLNTTFNSATQNSGPSFACVNPAAGSTGESTCTIASLPSRSVAVFTFTYQTDSSAAPGQLINSTASTTSATADSRVLDNSSTASAIVAAVTPNSPCSLECPNNIIVAADATHNGLPDGQPGAVVSFGSAEPFGSCGTVTTSQPSGSFFPVGTTTVTSTSSTGGGSCSFDVIVTAGGGPTISCPANVEVPATDGCTATVSSLGTPTTTGSGVTVEGSRSDGDALDAPYPLGTTTITWTATDDAGRVATCAQTVKVNASGNDAAAPTINAPPDLTRSTGASGGACGLIVTESEMGAAEAEDDGCAVTVTRTGVPAGNFFPVGTTTITWTATDAAGKTATDTQVVTIVEDTPPTINAPADASYTCPSEVPAADPSQATGTDDNLPNGGPVLDNCSVPVVTVSESVSGAGNAASPRIITRTFTATDAAGNSASDVQTITVVDDTPPVVTPPANVVTDAPANSCAVTVDPGAASVTDNCAGATVAGTRSDNQPLSAPYPGGATTTITWTATDANGNTTTATQTVRVNDVTAPAISLNDANPLTVECHTSFTDPGATASDSCDSAVPVASAGSVDANTPGTYVLTYTATDDSGNTASATRTVNVVDTTPPVMACPANIVVSLPLNSTATSMSVSYPAATATDSCGGALPVTYNVASGSVFNVGTTTVTASATDAAGNSASCSFTVTVRYNFAGFFSPVSNLPTLNSVNAGRALPLKFSLSGNKGLGIMAAGYPASQQVACDSSAPISDLEGTESSGGSTLTYSPDQYHYNWKTESGWAGTCRVLVVKLNDGSEHTALFKFK